MLVFSQAAEYVKASAVDAITIPVGPRLGDVVVQTQGLTKGFGDRVLIDSLDLDIPPGAVVGIIGGRGLRFGVENSLP